MSNTENGNKTLWNDIFRPVLVLLIISAVVAAALAGANSVTKAKIAELTERQKTESMQSLFPGAQFNQEKSSDLVPTSSVMPFEFYRVETNGKHEGYIFSTSAKGYGGDVSVMTAVTADGKIKAVKILDVSNETPGLGQNAAKKEFYGQLEGLSAENEIALNKIAASAEKNEITPVTGATITSKAVKEAVNIAIDRYKFIKEAEGGSNEK